MDLTELSLEQLTNIEVTSVSGHAERLHVNGPVKSALEQHDGMRTMEMGEMQASMKRMHEQMEKIRGTTDPEERQKLMERCMEMMRLMIEHQQGS